MMATWNLIDVTPEPFEGFRKFRCLCLEGSMKTTQTERILLGKHTANGFRFMTGDWQRVLAWAPFDDAI